MTLTRDIYRSADASSLSRTPSISSGLSATSSGERISPIAQKTASDTNIKMYHHESNVAHSINSLIHRIETNHTVTTSPPNDGNEPLDIEKGIQTALSRTGTATTDQYQLEQGAISPPNVAYSWVITCLVCLIMACTWGSSASYGVFLSYFIKANYYPGGTSVDFAMIGTLILFFTQFLTPFPLMLSSIIGFKNVCFIGTALLSGGFIAASFTTELWQLYLTFSFMVGTGFSFVFNPALTIAPTWFATAAGKGSSMDNSKRKKKKVSMLGFSGGIMSAGAGIGGVVFSLSAQRMMDITGDHKWAMRMIGIVVFVINSICVSLLKERIPKPRLTTWNDIRHRMNVILDWRIVKLYYIDCVGIWFSLMVMAYIVIMYSLSAMAVSIGLNARQGSHMTAIFNGCQAIGRPAIGLSSDFVGRVNLSLALTVFVAVIVLALWINTLSYSSLVAFSVLAGLTSGVANSLNTALLADSVPIELIPSGITIFNMSVGSFSLASEVSALKLRNMQLRRPFLYAQVFTGCVVLLALVCLAPYRERKIRQIFKQRLETLECELETGDEWKREDVLILEKKRNEYAMLLKSDAKTFFIRLCYPIKV